MMDEQGIYVEKIPKLRKPVLIAGFDGWGNAMEVSKNTVDYLITRLGGKPFAGLNPDMFYNYCETRPLVDVKDGVLNSVMPPGGNFYAIRTDSEKNDLVVLSANEPGIRWLRFADDFFDLCERLGVDRVITLGSMFDAVLHSEMIISGMASDATLLAELTRLNVVPISYHGGGGVHSLIQSEGEQAGIACASIWCHCPFYLEGNVHFGMMSQFVSMLASLADFELDTEELESKWRDVDGNIRELIDSNPNLQAVVSEVRKDREKGMRKIIKGMKSGNIINLKDFR